MSISGFPVTPCLRGHIDLFEILDNQARMSGWIFQTEVPFERLSITLNGNPWVEAPLNDRPDVAALFQALNISCPLKSGFDVTAPLFDMTFDPLRTSIAITPFSSGRAQDTLQSVYCQYDHERQTCPQPPFELQERIGGSAQFVETGSQTFLLLSTYIQKYKPFFAAERILDWGCGCGRVVAQLVKVVPTTKVYGCDIDSEAIGWASQNIPGVSFQAIAPYPPTNYPDNFFDIVYAVSVVTHLDEDTQFQWLQELRRITRPGAILVLTVLGSQMRTTNMPPELMATYEEQGFAVFVPGYSDVLAPFSEKNYYKEAFHSTAYIAEQWSQYFDILEYVETRWQDLVILRTR